VLDEAEGPERVGELVGEGARPVGAARVVMADMDGEIRFQAMPAVQRDDFCGFAFRPDRLPDPLAEGFDRLPGRTQVDDLQIIHDDLLE
jgi:hypothetical protein